ncbi:restriction endonuclease subunit S [Myceligenerans crystallogenes]|uniref:Type I restriction modification DNA specificity domain-containing protein n=1 Tax=Myceligenerans crystallogenes TaxID=316335 RepID=A0ABN2NLD5_9MICO
MSDWNEVPLGEIGLPGSAGFATGPFGSAVSSKTFAASGTPMIRGSNLSEDVSKRLVETEYVFLPDHIVQRFGRSIAKRGDLVFTCWGTIGQVGFIDKSSKFEKYLVSNKQMRMTPDPSRVDSRFLYYALSDRRMIDYVKSEAIGSSVPGFNLGQLKSLIVRVPELPEQRAIAAALGALDDKIAANAKLATVADELIRALFQRACGSARDHVRIDSLVSTVRDQVAPDGSGGVYVGLEHVPRHLMWLTDSGSAADVTSAKLRFGRGDILFGKLRPYFHKVSVAPSSGICSTDILVLRAKEPELAGFALAALSSDEVVAMVTASSEGTRMPRASWKDLAAAEISWPGDAPAREFSSRVASLRDLVQARLRENEQLAATRDALLPALMSGRLTVRDAEAAIGDLRPTQINAGSSKELV